MNISNALTILRIILLPLFAFTAINGSILTSIIIFISASLTDFFDGFLARRFNQVTLFGTILDPIADKFFISISFFMLYFINDHAKMQIIAQIIVITILRDIVIIFMILLKYDLKLPNTFKPSIMGKITTFIELITILISIISNIIEMRLWHQIGIYILYYLMVIFVCISGMHYYFRKNYCGKVMKKHIQQP